MEQHPFLNPLEPSGFLRHRVASLLVAATLLSGHRSFTVVRLTVRLEPLTTITLVLFFVRVVARKDLPTLRREVFRNATLIFGPLLLHRPTIPANLLFPVFALLT